MANYRNEFEFRSGLLNALGVEHSEADAKNEERWRAKMLDGLEVEYNQNDVNQFGLFREKLVEGVENYSGGGGGSSDFSTAQVTIVNGSGYNRILSMPVYYAAEDDEPALMNAYLNMLPNETVTVDVAVPIDGETKVYSGETGDKLQGVQMGSTLTVTSGSATQASNNRVTITGDCTITIS